MAEFFHTNGQAPEQGQVIARLPGKLEVQLYSWRTGLETVTRVVTEEEAKGWNFYNSQVQWRLAGDKICEKMFT